MNDVQRRFTAALIAAIAAALLGLLSRLIESRANSFADLLAVALGTGVAIFAVWPQIEQRWSKRDRQDDSKRFALMVAGVVAGIGLSMLPRLTGTGASGVFILLAAGLLATLVSRARNRVRRRPPAG